MSMEEKKKRLYESGYCASNEKVLSALWRAAFIAKICSIEIPNDIEVKTASQNEVANISAEPFSEALAHLFIMYGAGYISFEKLESIARDADKFKDEILSAENFIIEQSSKDEKECVSEDIIQRILFCTIN